MSWKVRSGQIGLGQFRLSYVRSGCWKLILTSSTARHARRGISEVVSFPDPDVLLVSIWNSESSSRRSAWIFQCHV
jgi:hypothetical protein